MIEQLHPLTLSLSKGRIARHPSFDRLRKSVVGVFLLGLYLLIIATPAAAQTSLTRQVVTSDGPSSVSVTIYRNPNRRASQAMNLRYLRGYALITEQRTITLPAGEVDLRFEGVAGGIIPQSAIVTGLANGVLEKNRDAALLSPSALLNGFLGRRVSIRRTSVATGKVREYEADIRTDARGGVVVATPDGFEALQCTGLNETLIYPEVPEGLSAKPTLSVKTRVSSPTRATVTLSYLATGFDWQANYVADVSADGETMKLFSWVTLANGDETSFIDAQTQTVAGQPNKGRDNIAPATGGSISLRCWPQGTTSDVAVRRFDRARNERKSFGLAMPAPMAVMEAASDMVVASAQKIEAKQEDLGDLKLYRIPVPVTVASKSQKQVTMFEKKSVPFDQVYEAAIWADDAIVSRPLDITLRFQNEKRNQLGLPLPAGKMVVFRSVGEARLLVGEGSLEDKAIGEEVEVTISKSPIVRYALEVLDSDGTEGKEYYDMQLTVTNASAMAANAEITIDHEDDEQLKKLNKKLGRKNGHAIWRVTVPANGERVLTYRVVR